MATTEGLVAFWDFAHSEGDGWISYHNSNTIDRTFPLWLRQIGDDAIYSASTWPYQDEDSLIMWDDTGPFGRAIRFNKGYIYGAVKREDFEETPLNIHGNQPFTMIAWVKFTGKRHLVAGIWDEGGWDKYSGRRQVALFGGLFGQKGVIAHISATGASSYPQSDAPGSQYARVRAIDGQPFKDDAWVSMAMTFDPETNACTAYLNGEMTPLKISDPVAQDVYQFEKPVYANPYNFSFPIYSPRAFVLKYNGYLHKGPVQEHRLHVDLDSGLLYYSRDEKVPGDKRSFRVRFDVRREDSSLLSEAVIMYAITGAVGHLPSGLKIEDGD
ncbi:MAG: hypothetical protein KJT03_06700, partial [Verrucomicrobiae bacterium]|nr:hypothetical protein [Verrucomicrobiae bacterium]